MANYKVFGNLLLGEALSEDPFGTVHRGIARTGPLAGDGVMIRRYHPQWQDAGLRKHQGEIRRNLIKLGRVSLYRGMHLSLEGTPHFVWPLCRGRSLVTVLRAAETQGFPFGIDQSLFLVWVLAHHISQVHAAGLPLGFLSPHRVWVGFDGLVELLDTPVIGILEALAPTVPGTTEALGPYLQGPHGEGIMHDAYQLGALLIEMLTHHSLPIGLPLHHVLTAACLHDCDGSHPLPEPLKNLLSRLLGQGRPFASLVELEGHLEDSLFRTDSFNPTTFGIAFTMHTLFRREILDEKEEEEDAEPGGNTQIELPSFQPPQMKVPKPSRAPRLLKKAAGLGFVLVTGAGLLGTIRMHSSAPPSPTKAQVAPTPEPAEGSPGGIQTPSLAQHAAVRPCHAPPSPAPDQPGPAAQQAERALQPPPEPALAVRTASVPASENPASHPVRLRIFVDEHGKVRQALVLEGAAKGSPRETAAVRQAMDTRLRPPGDGHSPERAWIEVTLSVK